MKDMMDRRQFAKMLGVAAGTMWIGGCSAADLFGASSASNGDSSYSVARLGDTHFDAEPSSVYHSLYAEARKGSKVHYDEFRRNGEMLAKMFAEKWIPMEEKYFDAFSIKERADIVISTE